MSNDCKEPEGERLTGDKFIIMITFGFTICIFSIGCNAIILVAFALKKTLRKPPNLLLVNLALGDVVYCLVGFPINMMPDIDRSLLCLDSIVKSRNFVAAFTICVSINNIATVALERFVAVQFPYFYSAHVTLKTTVLMAMSSCVVSALEAIVFNVVYFSYDPRLAMNIIIAENGVVFILSVSLYICIYRLVRRLLKRDRALGIVNKDSKTTSAVTVAGVCVISWLPVLVVRIVNQIVDVGPWRQITVLSPLLGTSFNLFIYTLGMRDFRTAVKELLFTRRVRVGPIDVTKRENMTSNV